MYFRALGNRIVIFDWLLDAKGKRHKQRIIATVAITDVTPASIKLKLTDEECDKLAAMKKALFLARRKTRLLRQVARLDIVLADITTALTDPAVLAEIETPILRSLQNWCIATNDRLLELQSRPTRMSNPVVITEDTE